MTTETKSTDTTARIQNWTQDELLTKHSMKTYEEASAYRTEIYKTKSRQWLSTHQVKVRKYPLNARPRTPVTFSVLVFKPVDKKASRLNPHPDATGQDAYTIHMPAPKTEKL